LLKPRQIRGVVLAETARSPVNTRLVSEEKQEKKKAKIKGIITVVVHIHVLYTMLHTGPK